MDRSEYSHYASERLAGGFSRMGSWRLVAPFLAGARTLDVGCSDGLYLQDMAAGSVGIEQVPALAARARERGLSVICGDLDAELRKVSSESFDAVLFSHVLEHVDSPIATLRQIQRVLRPGGVLVLGLPIERNIYRDLLRRDYFDGTHIYAFSVRNAFKLLRDVGLEPKRTLYHLPKCRSRAGLLLLRAWNGFPWPGREYLSMAYWIVAARPRGEAVR